ncbi:MAG: TonB-dependent receptor [Spongiibacteraceae bacterium]
MRIKSQTFTPLNTKRKSGWGRCGISCFTAASSVVACLGLTSLAHAKEPARGASAILDEVVVTARKREEQVQDVPLSVSAFSVEQMDALKLRDLTDLSVGTPNVSLDDAGSAKGYANFSIRGLGINSSILSIDPTVGVFVDGVYMGVPAGMLFDVFDLQRIEVLRGPQGTLFGRNVTGGAVLMTTKKPSNVFEMTIRGAVDMGDQGGLNKYLMGTVSGPLTDSFSGKITAYLNKDDGWFENKYTGDDFGKNDQQMFRTVGLWKPTDSTEIILRWEHDKNESDGPAGQTHTNGSGVPGANVNFNRDSHDFSIDEEGYYDTKTDFVTLEINQGVGFGDGTITNIMGWRSYEAESLGDIDSQPVWLFHSMSFTEAEQFSDELRYTGRFMDKLSLTTGLYYFTNNVDYAERRKMLGVLLGGTRPYVTYDGGGYYSVDTMAGFVSADYDLTDALTLNAGLRYSYEEKEAKIASLSRNVTLYTSSNTCNLVDPAPGERKCAIDFEDKDSWDDFSPRLGLTYELSANARVYGVWSQGFRSGGYNLRNTSLNPADVPGPFDQEKVTNYEVGFKSEFGRARFNAAIFYNEVKDMQRELNFAGPIGVVQLIRNTADADLMGVELDGAYGITDHLVVNFSAGWLDAEYSKVTADLNRDGVIDSRDKSLELPRAPEWTYSVGLNHDFNIGDSGYINSYINYAYRDDSYYTDDNLGYLLEQEIVDIGIDYHTNDESWVIGIYGKNLLDDVSHGGDTQLPNTIGPRATGGTFAPLSKGRVYGAQVTYNFK